MQSQEQSIQPSDPHGDPKAQDPHPSLGGDSPIFFGGDPPSSPVGHPNTPVEPARTPPNLNLASFSSIFNIGSTKFTANPTAFLLAPGMTVSAGGPAVEISGTSVSLNPSGSLIIRTRTVPLELPQSADPKLLMSVVNLADGEAVTLNAAAGGSGGVIVDGMTMSAGGVGMTIGASDRDGNNGGGDGGGNNDVGEGDGSTGDGHGVFVSVGSGFVEVGTETIRLPTAVPGGASDGNSGSSIDEFSSGCAKMNRTEIEWWSLVFCWLTYIYFAY